MRRPSVPSIRKPIATNPDRRPSEARPPVSDRKPPAAERSEAAGVGPKGRYEPNRTDRSGSKAYRNDQLWKKSVESHLVKHIYTVHTRMHTYIHKWTSCMAFKLWNTVDLVIGPRPSLLFQEIPFNFEFEISSNGIRTSDVLEIWE